MRHSNRHSYSIVHCCGGVFCVDLHNYFIFLRQHDIVIKWRLLSHLDGASVPASFLYS